MSNIKVDLSSNNPSYKKSSSLNDKSDKTKDLADFSSKIDHFKDKVSKSGKSEQQAKNHRKGDSNKNNTSKVETKVATQAEKTSNTVAEQAAIISNEFLDLDDVLDQLELIELQLNKDSEEYVVELDIDLSEECLTVDLELTDNSEQDLELELEIDVINEHDIEQVEEEQVELTPLFIMDHAEDSSSQGVALEEQGFENEEQEELVIEQKELLSDHKEVEHGYEQEHKLELSDNLEQNLEQEDFSNKTKGDIALEKKESFQINNSELQESLEQFSLQADKQSAQNTLLQYTNNQNSPVSGSITSNRATEITVEQPLGSNQWGQEFASKISILSNANTELQTAKVNVNPSELGPIHVKIEVKENKLDLQFDVLNTQTKSILENSSTEIVNSLSDNMNFVDVNINFSSQEFQESGENNNEEFSSSTINTELESDVNEMDPSEPIRKSDHIVDIKV